jgi:hypothetical protein
MRVKVISEIQSVKGIILAGQIIEIPSTVMVKLKGKVIPIADTPNVPSFVVDNTESAMTEAYIKVEPPPVRPIKTAANEEKTWTPDIQSLIDWFVELEPPTVPFYLEPHRKVIDPEKFFASLRQEIAVGPRCPRNRNGALLFDLGILKKNLH